MRNYDEQKKYEEDLLDQTFGTYEEHNAPTIPMPPVKRTVGQYIYDYLGVVVVFIFVSIVLIGAYQLFIHRNDPRPEPIVDTQVVQPRFYIESCADGVTLLIVEPPYHSSTATVLYKRDINDKLVACNLK